MKKEKLLDEISKLKAGDGWGVQELLNKDYEAHCPCFSARFIVDGEYNEVWARCWRVSENDQDLHCYGDKDIAHAIKDCLDAQAWYNPYKIIWHRKPFLAKENIIKKTPKNL